VDQNQARGLEGGRGLFRGGAVICASGERTEGPAAARRSSRGPSSAVPIGGNAMARPLCAMALMATAQAKLRRAMYAPVAVYSTIREE
jgi:hypothetical protein